MTSAALQSALERVPRFPLGALPTPLQEANRLREALDGSRRCPRIFLKRDDLTGLALGGNKARKLEFLLADALAQGADTLITTGATQSNHARMTAAAARVAGLDCHLVLSSRSATPPLEGNLLLDRLYGATVHHVLPSEDPTLPDAEDDKVKEVVSKLEVVGKKPYLIPLGGSNAVGTLGYTLATLEILEQLSNAGIRPSRLYYASGSRGTQAGLVLGAKYCVATYRLNGIAVSPGTPEKTQRAIRIANMAADLLGIQTRIQESDLSTDYGFMGEGYGIPTPECLEAITLLARTEGVLLDPCYTGKAMAGLLAHVRSGEVKADETVVFLHTGGVPALFTAEFSSLIQPYL